jgi:AmmeMemoRadiSam system protein B
MKKKLILISLLVFFITTGILFKNKIKETSKIKSAHTTLETDQDQRSISGIILPHHDFAKEIIIDSYQRLSKENFDLIVIISPNHFYPKIGNILSGRIIDHNRHNLQTANYLIDELLEANLIKVEDQVVAKEHGINTQLNYLSQFYPGIEVLSIVMPVNPNQAKFKKLQDILANLPPKTLFIASVDFAHDLTYLESLKNNQESIEAIKNFNYEQISHFDNRHLDSPKSIILFLEIMKQKNANNFQVLHNTHGALLSNQTDLVGTSYVVGVFSQNKY